MEFPKLDPTLIDTHASKNAEQIKYLDPRIDPKLIEGMVINQVKTDTGIQGALETVRLEFPRISTAIRLTWGSNELHEKLSHMIHVDTEGRQGFPHHVLEALIKIFNHHADTFNLEPVSPDTTKNSRLNRQDTW